MSYDTDIDVDDLPEAVVRRVGQLVMERDEALNERDAARAAHRLAIGERDAARAVLSQVHTEVAILADEFESDGIDDGEKLKCARKTIEILVEFGEE